MGRPNKKGLDFFRHYAKIQGKTMDTLQSIYGNDGYAFWFKILEVLAQQEGLFYDCNSTANWRYLSANARLTCEKAEEIMGILCDLEAIDVQLWKERRIIWVQKFTDSVEDVFRKRGAETPVKPSFCDGNNITVAVSVTESTQRKVK